jgi:hypothetical protein
MNKIGLILAIIYILVAAQPLWFAFVDPGNAPYILMGSRFGLFVVTLPGSAFVEWFKNFAGPGDYSLREKIESAVYIVSLLVNIVVLYFLGSLISKLYGYFIK